MKTLIASVMSVFFIIFAASSQTSESIPDSLKTANIKFITITERPNMWMLGISFVGIIMAAKSYADYSRHSDNEDAAEKAGLIWEAGKFNDDKNTALTTAIFGVIITGAFTYLTLHPETRRIGVYPALIQGNNLGAQLTYSFKYNK